LSPNSGLIESIISEGQFRGELKPNLDVKLMRKMIFGTMDEVVTSWVMSKRQEELKSLSEQVFLLLSEGIISKK
jgi:TetR/AcrR family fatty acid metabolism transcriptional regulator